MHRFFVAHQVLAQVLPALSPRTLARDSSSEETMHAGMEQALSVALPDKLAHQVRDVLHLGVGEHLVLLDNSGAEFLAAIAKSGRTGVEVEVLEHRKGKSESPVRIVLCQGLLKSARF